MSPSPHVGPTRGRVLSTFNIPSSIQPQKYRVSKLWYIDENKNNELNLSINEATLIDMDEKPVAANLDHLQKLEAVEFIARHVEEITPTIVLSDTDSTTVDSPLNLCDESHIDIKATEPSHVVSTNQETRQIVHEILAIALPSLGGMLLDPIMSLIDTACVGQISTTALAAMAPCTSIFQFCFFAFFFLSAATTNLVASNPPETLVGDGKEAARRVLFNEKVVSNASLLAVLLGTAVSGALFKFCDPLLSMAGIPASNTALLQAARPYLLIRAVGIPFVFLATVLQGASLGRGNAMRPLKIFGAAGVINLIGDVYLTLMKGWGATGAAVATVAAQIGAALYYVVSTSRLDKSVEASSKAKRDVALSWKGFATKDMLKTFASVAFTLFSRSIGMMMAYSMLTRAAALSGTAALAAHQVTLQVWWLVSFLPEPMSVAAQTLITRDRTDRPSRVPKLIKTLYTMSVALGASASLLTLVALRAPAIVGALVADVSVQAKIASLVPLAVLSQGYCPLGTLSDGVCIGLDSFGHLPGIMIGSFAATAAALSMVAKHKLGVVGVWGCMNVFLTARVFGHLLTSSKLKESIRNAFGKQPNEVDAVAI
eukprot:scaffold379435_cov79-Cyclotella_meneghiniana.AAC.2